MKSTETTMEVTVRECKVTRGAGVMGVTVHKKRVKKAHREENTRLRFNKTKKKVERVRLGSYIPLRQWARMAAKKETDLGRSCQVWLNRKEGTFLC